MSCILLMFSFWNLVYTLDILISFDIIISLLDFTLFFFLGNAPHFSFIIYIMLTLIWYFENGWNNWHVKMVCAVYWVITVLLWSADCDSLILWASFQTNIARIDVEQSVHLQAQIKAKVLVLRWVLITLYTLTFSYRYCSNAILCSSALLILCG